MQLLRCVSEVQFPSDCEEIFKLTKFHEYILNGIYAAYKILENWLLMTRTSSMTQGRSGYCPGCRRELLMENRVFQGSSLRSTRDSRSMNSDRDNTDINGIRHTGKGHNL